MALAKRLELERVRGGGGQNKVVRLAPNEGAFVLGFPVPTRAGFSYLAVIRHEKGGAVVSQMPLEPNPVGYFNLVCDRTAFAPGTYTLSVFETRPHAPEPERLVVKYELSVEFEPPPTH